MLGFILAGFFLPPFALSCVKISIRKNSIWTCQPEKVSFFRLAKTLPSTKRCWQCKAHNYNLWNVEAFETVLLEDFAPVRDSTPTNFSDDRIKEWSEVVQVPSSSASKVPQSQTQPVNISRLWDGENNLDEFSSSDKRRKASSSLWMS